MPLRLYSAAAVWLEALSRSPAGLSAPVDLRLPLCPWPEAPASPRPDPTLLPPLGPMRTLLMTEESTPQHRKAKQTPPPSPHNKTKCDRIHEAMASNESYFRKSPPAEGWVQNGTRRKRARRTSGEGDPEQPETLTAKRSPRRADHAEVCIVGSAFVRTLLVRALLPAFVSHRQTSDNTFIRAPAGIV